MNDAQKACLGGIATQEPEAVKHIELDRAIQYQERVSARLDALIERISGDGEQDGGQNIASGICPRPVPTLSNVLNNGPERIRKNTEEALDLITRLENLLF